MLPDQRAGNEEEAKERYIATRVSKAKDNTIKRIVDRHPGSHRRFNGYHRTENLKEADEFCDLTFLCEVQRGTVVFVVRAVWPRESCVCR
jgi:hypothetical protein